nr:protein cornichon homolog 4-like [Ipomoea batatas]
MADVWEWVLVFFTLLAITILVVYQLTCLADLECDYINPYDSASRINKVVLPEYIMQGVLCLLYLGTGHWIMALLCGPYLYHNVQLYLQRQHLIDVTEIFNQLNREKNRRLWKLGYLVILVFISLVMLGSLMSVGLFLESGGNVDQLSPRKEGAVNKAGPAATNRPATPPPTTRPSGLAKETLIPPDLLRIPPDSEGINDPVNDNISKRP